MTMMLMSTLTFAQIQKGAVQLGGSITYNEFENRFQESKLFQVLPQAGLFVSDNTSIGLSLGYSYQETPVNFGQSEVRQFLLGMYSRFHKTVSDKFYMFLQPAFTFGFNRFDGTHRDNFTINVAPGLMYFVSEKIALEMNVGELFYTNTNISGGLKSDNFGLSFDLSRISLGASIYLK